MDAHEGLKAAAAEFSDTRSAFDGAVRDLVELSVRMSGTPSRHGREFWSSVLVAKLTLTGMTLNKLIPKYASAELDDLWDMGSVATLVRGLAENYLLLVWLCAQTEEQALWDYRITALTIMDNRARYRLTAEVEGEAEPEGFVAAQQVLGERLSAMSLFQELTQRRQRELLRGNKMPFIQDEIVDSLDMDRDSFRKLYRYLSSFVHTGTVSFIRMQEHNRGNGEYNEYDAAAIRAAMEFSVMVVRGAVSDVEQIIGN